MGFWDPRSDDDQLQVTCVQFQEEQLVVGLQGGMVLLFQINKQSANVTIQVGKSGREGGEGRRGREGREGASERGRERGREGRKGERKEGRREGGTDGRGRREGGRKEGGGREGG